MALQVRLLLLVKPLLVVAEILPPKHPDDAKDERKKSRYKKQLFFFCAPRSTCIACCSLRGSRYCSPAHTLVRCAKLGHMHALIPPAAPVSSCARECCHSRASSLPLQSSQTFVQSCHHKKNPRRSDRENLASSLQNAQPPRVFEQQTFLSSGHFQGADVDTERMFSRSGGCWYQPRRAITLPAADASVQFSSFIPIRFVLTELPSIFLFSFFFSASFALSSRLFRVFIEHRDGQDYVGLLRTTSHLSSAASSSKVCVRYLP